MHRITFERGQKRYASMVFFFWSIFGNVNVAFLTRKRLSVESFQAYLLQTLLKQPNDSAGKCDKITSMISTGTSRGSSSPRPRTVLPSPSSAPSNPSCFRAVFGGERDNLTSLLLPFRTGVAIKRSSTCARHAATSIEVISCATL